MMCTQRDQAFLALNSRIVTVTESPLNKMNNTREAVAPCCSCANEWDPRGDYLAIQTIEPVFIAY